MGIACKINRDSSGRPTSVLTENGNKSKLFADALKLVKDPHSALELYATIFTDEFQQEVLEPLRFVSKLDKNGEPKIDAVVDYITTNIKEISRPGFNRGVERVKQEAREFKKKFKIKGVEHPPVYKLDKGMSKEISKAYESMKHEPNNPKVKEAYKAMMEDTMNQFNFIKSKGIKIIRHEGEGEPYQSSGEMLEDLERGQLKFLPNEVAFGETGDSKKFSDNIALQDSGARLDDGYTMTNSEVFRVVHDYFGHGILGNQFGAIGEENATLQHAAMFSEEALPAMIAQTRGQNSWVNFSGANKKAFAKFKEAKDLERQGNREKAKKVREEAQKLFKFAEPKVGLLPEKYNFIKYETTRRIEEGKRIDSRATPRDSDLPTALEKHTERSRATRGVRKRSLQETRSIRNYDVNVVNEFTLDGKIDASIRKAYPGFQGVQKIYEITNGDVYREIQIEALKDHPFRASVTVHSAEEYENMRMFITEDGATGVTLTKDGFLGGAFSSKKNNLPQLMILGVKEGAITAEAFDTVLPDYYANFGFKAVSRTAFNDEYKPMIANGALADWDYHTYRNFNNGRPDVVFMIYDGGDRNTVEERTGQFDLYKSYEKNNTTSYDKDSYDDAYKDMEVAAVKRGDFEESQDKPTKQKNSNSKIDENGEPSLKVLTNYITSKNWEGKGLDFTQMRDVKKALQTIPDFRNKVSSAFYSSGIFSLSEDKLVGSGLYNRAEAREVMTNPEIQQSLRATIEGFMNTRDADLGTKFQIAGVLGASRLDRVEESTRRLDNLQAAKALEADGVDPAFIKEGTGWERGADKLWRYEVNEDALISDNFDYKNAWETERLYSLEEVIGEDHKLFKMYPQLKKMGVGFKSHYVIDGDNVLTKQEALYDPTNNNVVFNKNKINYGDLSDYNSILVHEVQHAIQHIEGFAKGGNESTMFFNEGLVDKFGRLDRVKTRNFQLKQEQILLEQRDRLIDILGDREGTAEELRELGIYREARLLSAQIDALSKWSVYPGSTDFAQIYYHTLSGEIESRNAQERIGMGHVARRSSLLELTEDVAREDQVIMMKDSRPSAFMNSAPIVKDTESLLKPVIDKLKKSGLAKDVRVQNSEEFEKSMEAIAKNSPYFPLEDALKAKGLVHGNVIFLNSDKLTLDTPIHEFAHMWLHWAKENKPALYERGINLIKANGKKYIEHVHKTQPDLVYSDVLEEALAEAIGDQGARFIMKNEQMSFSGWLKSLWKAIKEAVGISEVSEDRLANMSLEEFSEAVAMDLMKGSDAPFKTRPYTIQPLLDDMLANKEGKMVNTQTIRQITKQKGIKKIEKEILEEVLELPAYKGKNKIPFTLFQRDVQDRLMPLTVMETDSYSTYGSDWMEEYFDEQISVIYNSDYIHGDTGHFNGDFRGMDTDIEFDIHEMEGTFVVVKRGVPLTQVNIQNNIFTASATYEGAEEWVANYKTKKSNTSGLFGHTRVWYSGHRAFMAEVQSDSYQKASAEEMLVDAYHNDPTLLNEKQKAIFDKYNESIKTVADKYPSKEQNLHTEIHHINSAISDKKEEIGKFNRRIEAIEDKLSHEHSLESNRLLVVKRDLLILETVQKNLFKVATTGVIPTDYTEIEFELAKGVEKYYVHLDADHYFTLDHRGKLKTSSNYGASEVDMQNHLDNKISFATRNIKVDTKEYEKLFHAVRNIPKLKSQLVKAASIRDKQWLAHRKNYTERLVREEIRRSAEKGRREFLIPTARTLAIIEGYSSFEDSRMPYEVQEADDHERLEPGDTIDMDGYSYKVVWSDSADIEVVSTEDVSIVDENDYMSDEAIFRAEDQLYEDLSELRNYKAGEEWLVTKEQWEEAKDDMYNLGQFELEDLADEVDGETYKIDVNKAQNLLAEVFLENNNIEQYLSDMGYSNIQYVGNYNYMYTEYNASSEYFKQPDNYEDIASDEEFDLEDYNSEEQTVLRKYVELAEFFKKERPDAERIQDDNGAWWYSTKLTPEDGVKPVVMFQMPKIEQQPLTEFFQGDKDTSKMNSLGMFEAKNPYIQEKLAVQELGGIKDRTEFEEMLNNSEFESLKLRYNQDSNFADAFFKRFSSLDRVREFKIGDNGLERKNTVETLEVFEETLTTSSNDISEQIRFLEVLPADVWRHNPSEMQTILEGVRRMAVDIGLNLEGLEDMYFERSQDELINLLTAVKNVNLQTNKRRLVELAEAYDKFYRTEKKRAVVVTSVPKAHKDKSLVSLTTNKSDYEVFVDHSLLKVGENLYQKIKKADSLEAMYEQLTTSVMADPSSFPINTEVSPTGNRDKVEKAIREFVEGKASEIEASNVDNQELLMMAAYKHYFNTEWNTTSEVDVNKEQLKYDNFEGDFEYLTTEFIADFNKAAIEAKQSGNPAFEEFYKNFKIDSRGVILENRDEITMEAIKDYIKSGRLGSLGENLKQYSIISRDSGIDIIEEAESTTKTDEFFRDFYVNNPKQAPKVGNFTNLDSQTIAVKGAPKFIMTSKGLYEAVAEIGNIGFYGKLPINTGNYNILNVDKPVVDASLIDPKMLPGEGKAVVRVSNKLTKIEQEKINNEQFSCE